MDTKLLSGRVAIVTGAARGFGRAIALRLAEDGAKIVATDLHKELVEQTVQKIQEMGGQALAHNADISNEAQVNAMVAAAAAAFGTVDILVNNAGFMRTTTPTETIPLDEWNTTMDINATGVFLCMKTVLPILKEKRSGKIVNISSSAGRQKSTFCGAHYTASKAAVLGLTRHAAYEYAQYNININAVAPGTFITEGAKEELKRVNLTEEVFEVEKQKVPMRRFGTPQEVADLVAFLSSDQSSYITGATVDINGGDLMM